MVSYKERDVKHRRLPHVDIRQHAVTVDAVARLRLNAHQQGGYSLRTNAGLSIIAPTNIIKNTKNIKIIYYLERAKYSPPHTRRAGLIFFRLCHSSRVDPRQSSFKNTLQVRSNRSLKTTSAFLKFGQSEL